MLSFTLIVEITATEQKFPLSSQVWQYHQQPLYGLMVREILLADKIAVQRMVHRLKQGYDHPYPAKSWLKALDFGFCFDIMIDGKFTMSLSTLRNAKPKSIPGETKQ